MPRGRIQDLNSFRDAAERLAFETTLFTTKTGSADAGVMRWGDEVEVLERDGARVRVKADDGRTGWVLKGDVVELRWVKKRSGCTAPLYRNATGSEKLFDLLWGDPVLVLTTGPERWRVRARGWRGWIAPSNLVTEPLLELYFIDVGQGDGVLIRSPDGRHFLIDGGYQREKQPTGKSAADFVDWKFFVDYGLARVGLHAMLASHCDADHYGGLWDLLRTDLDAADELDCAGTDVEHFYHAGVSWWRPGNRHLGRNSGDGKWLIDLLGDHASLVEALKPDAERRLQGEWADFLREVRQATSSVHRVGVDAGSADPVHLPGFGPGDAGPTIRVLGPVVHEIDGRPSVKDLGKDDKNTNGHSMLLRLDYGAVRVLLTGDLNQKSMHLLLEEYEGNEDVFASDVAKGCHHGADDFSFRFLEHINAAATIISSGDNEGHAHPRAPVVGAAGLTGFRSVNEAKDELVTPIVYSTEVERSIAIGRCGWLETMKYPHEAAEIELRLYARDARFLPAEWKDDVALKANAASAVHYEITPAGALHSSRKSRDFRGAYVVSGLVYGLVNVRTDGETVMCATMNEKDRGWTVQEFPGRF